MLATHCRILYICSNMSVVPDVMHPCIRLMIISSCVYVCLAMQDKSMYMFIVSGWLNISILFMLSLWHRLGGKSRYFHMLHSAH